MEVECSLSPDKDGFLTQECPYCNKRFKAAFDKGSEKPLSCCPYCGQEAPNWFTIEQIQYLDSFGSGTMPAESTQKMQIHKFGCCGDRIKHDGSKKKLYCIVCGERETVGK